MRILVTGHKGLIGTYILQKFREHDLELFDIKEGKDVNDLNENSFPEKKFDMIIHCAAFCRIRETIKDPIQAHITNAQGTIKVLEFARKTGVQKVIIFSSSRVLSNEKNVYTATKIYGEELVKAYSECYGIDYLIIRPSTVFGEHDSNDRIIPKFINSALNNETLTIYGDKNKTLDITYIQDFMEAFDAIYSGGEWNQEYNVGNGFEVNVEELARYIIEFTGSKSELKFLPAETAQPQKVMIDISKIEELGYKPRVYWKYGINKTINWIRSGAT